MSMLKTFFDLWVKKVIFPSWVIFVFHTHLHLLLLIAPQCYFEWYPYFSSYHPTCIEFPTTPTLNSNRYIFVFYQVVCTSYAIGTFMQILEDQPFLLTAYHKYLLPTYSAIKISVLRVCVCTSNNAPATKWIMFLCQIAVHNSSSSLIIIIFLTHITHT